MGIYVTITERHRERCFERRRQSSLKYFASGLLFDNDGVLVDSHEASGVAWAIWSKEYAPHFEWDVPENAGVRAEDKVREYVSPEMFEVANDRINELEQQTANETVPLGWLGGIAALRSSQAPGLSALRQT